MTKFAETQKRSSIETQPTPQLLFETLNAYQRTEALKTGIELDLFSVIAEGARTPDAIARRCNTSARGARILCDYLVVIGFLTKSNNEYSLTTDTAMFLDRNSPAYAGTIAKFLAAPVQTAHFKDLTGAVRKGGAVDEEMLAPDDPIWVDFARGMAPLMSLGARLIPGLLEAEKGQRWKVLDIAAGHGLFGIEIAKQNPNAQIVAVDWLNVLAVARENAQAAGVIDRYETIPGSAFDVDFGAGYDVAVITNFLHMFDAATGEKLLEKVHTALKPGGRAIVLEFVPNDDRVSPPVAASFALTMLVNTAAGDTRTATELKQMCRNAGFSSADVRPLLPTFQHVTIAQK